MKLFRLNRLFNGKSRRCFDVAIDHGFFNELGFLSGIEDLEKAVETLVGAGPDAIQLTGGQAEVLQRIPGKAKPALVLRTDVANVYGRALPRTLFSRMIDQAVEQALRLDATCVVVNLFQIPEQPEVSDQCIRNIAKLKPECDRYAMPADDRALGVSAQRAGRRLHRRRGPKQGHAAGAPSGRTRSRCHQGRSY